MNRRIRMALLLTAVLVVLVLAAGCGASKSTATVSSPTAPATPTAPVCSPRTYAPEEVAKHATRGDCWLIIEGRVYDVTKFIPTHPGGEAILQGCGKDATQLFETRPMGSGTPHSTRARTLREGYLIGEVK